MISVYHLFHPLLKKKHEKRKRYIEYKVIKLCLSANDELPTRCRSELSSKNSRVSFSVSQFNHTYNFDINGVLYLMKHTYFFLNCSLFEYLQTNKQTKTNQSVCQSSRQFPYHFDFIPTHFFSFSLI